MQARNAELHNQEAVEVQRLRRALERARVELEVNIYTQTGCRWGKDEHTYWSLWSFEGGRSEWGHVAKTGSDATGLTTVEVFMLVCTDVRLWVYVRWFVYTGLDSVESFV